MKIDPTQKVAVVTGANRGLGFETSRQLAAKGYQVLLTSRSLRKAEAAAAELAKSGAKVFPYELDVTDRTSIIKLRDYLRDQVGRLDVLVNNAGIFQDTPEPGKGNPSAFQVDIDVVRATLETNLYGPYQLCQVLIPLMQKAGTGRVVNVASQMGQLSEMNSGYPAYRISKTALNAVTRVFSQETQGTDILVNSACPGWVKTDMGGPGAELTPEQGADTLVWLATLPLDGPTGGFFQERKLIAW